MKLVCPTCQTVYQVPDERLTSPVAQAVCKKCGATLRITKPPLEGTHKPKQPREDRARHPRPTSQLPTVMAMSSQQASSKDYLAIGIVAIAVLILLLSTAWVIRDIHRFFSGPGKTLTQMIEEITGFNKSNRAKGIKNGDASDRRIQKLLKKGHRHFYARRYDQALGQYQAAIKLDPNSADAYFWRGRAELKTGRHDLAINDFEQVLSIEPKHRRACDNLGWLYMQKKDYPKSLHYLDRSLHLKPDNGWAYFTRSHVYHRLGESQKALSDARKACDLGRKKACEFYEKHKQVSLQ